MQPLPAIDIHGVWHLTYFIGLSLSLILVRDSWPLLPRLFLCWILLQCLFILEFPEAHYGPYTPYFQSTAGQVFIEALLVTFAAIEFRAYIMRLIPILAFFSAACVWCNWIGFLHAPSFNMALAAACIPVIGSPYLVAFVVLTALTHHGSTALVIMAAQAFAYVLNGYIKRRYVVAGLVVMLASAFVFQRQAVFNSGERLDHWAEYLRFWWDGGARRVLLGWGPGSFVWYTVMTHKAQTGFYLQMHNDYLQVLWENGLVGFGLMAGVIYQAVRKPWRNPKLLSGVLGCLAFGLTYSPLRFFPTAILTAWFFARVLIVEQIEV